MWKLFEGGWYQAGYFEPEGPDILEEDGCEFWDVPLAMPNEPRDKNGTPVRLGTRVRLLGLSGKWLEDLPEDEKAEVLSMIGEVFEIDDIDEQGRPWISKSWPESEEGRCHGHTISLESYEMEVVAKPS